MPRPVATPENWSDPLRGVERTLQQTLAWLEQVDRGLTEIAPASETPAQRLQSACTAQAAGWQTLVDGAAAATAEADAALGEHEALLRQKLDLAANLRQTLATWALGAVG